ncbi:MAG: PDZ domain-containing protein, partial [Planctomycetota bacterium]
EKYVKGRFPRFPGRVIQGLPLDETMRKKLEEDLKRMRGRWKEADRVRREMEERWRKWRGGFPPKGNWAGGVDRIIIRNADGQIDLERKEDGRIILGLDTRDKEGNRVKERYEAASEEEFKKKFPEIYKKHVEGKLGKNGIQIEIEPGFGGQALRKRGPGLGIEAGRVTELMRVHLDLDAREGFVVNGVFPGSLAEKAGIRKWDLILKAAGKGVAHPREVSAILAAAPGPIELEVVRRGKRITISLEK